LSNSKIVYFNYRIIQILYKKRLFDYNNQVFKKIINSNITYLNDTIIKKKFQFINNIQTLITNEECILKQKKLIKDNKLDIIEPSSFESKDSKSRMLLNNLPSGKIVNEPYQATLDKLGSSSTMMNKPGEKVNLPVYA
jgi:hypothetical protein